MPNKRGKTTFYSPKYSTANSDNEIKKIFGSKVFSYSKSKDLIKDFIYLSNTNSNDIILDFFAGSGTTAHAVMELNAQDNGNRQFILVQLDEKIDPTKASGANKATIEVAYKFCKNELGSENPTIFDITKERIKRASAKIAQSQSKTHPLAPLVLREGEQECVKYTSEGESLDLGFKVYEIRKNDLQSNNDSLFDSINLSDDDKNALLESFKLQDSLPLTLQNHRVDLGGYEGILAGEKLYLLNSHFTTKHLQNLIEKIDTQSDFVIKEISYLNNVFDSAKIREIEEGIKSYANKKGLKILVRARFI